MFCTDDRCYLPLHNLITDMVESFGGSALLIRILNRLGICSSADTLARSIQYRVKESEQKCPEQECKPNSVTIISADNIDFMHSYARVFCGNQASIWHGTTVQAVQPKPAITQGTPCSTVERLVPVIQTPPTLVDNVSQGEVTQALLTMDSSSTSRHSEHVSGDVSVRLSHRKRSTRTGLHMHHRLKHVDPLYLKCRGEQGQELRTTLHFQIISSTSFNQQQPKPPATRKLGTTRR